MKVIIDIPQDHKRVIDNLVSDGKGYLLPQEVETRLARAVKIGTVVPDNATNGDRRLIDADRLLQHTKFYNLKNGNRAIDEIDILHAPPVQAILIPEGATNGDMIKAMFPDIESRLDENTGIILVKWVDGTTKTFKASWWNAPYKKCEG